VAAAPASAAGTVLGGGSSASFTWRYDVSGSGTVSFTSSASGVEANIQGALNPAPVTSSPISVQRPGQLSIAATASPAQVSAGLQQVALSVVLQNTGEADVILDTVPQPAVTSTASASANLAGSPPSAAGTVLSGGVSKSLIWTWNMGGAGTVSFTASATGQDGSKLARGRVRSIRRLGLVGGRRWQPRLHRRRKRQGREQRRRHRARSPHLVDGGGAAACRSVALRLGHARKGLGRLAARIVGA